MMIASSWRRVGVLLLAVWLLADTAALGFCDAPPAIGSASTHVSAGDCSDAAPSTAGQCFCCSQLVAVVRFDLLFTEERVHVAAPEQARPPDISIRNSSPPPRL